jgi:single-strand DNA-binding protein
MRQLIITGNLVSDIDLSITTEGKGIAKGSIANNDVKDGTIFVDFKAFGKTADLMAQYLSKGSKCLLCGDIMTDRWEKEGKKYEKDYMIVNKVEFLDKKGDSNETTKS